MLVKVNFFLEERGRKANSLGVRGTGHVQMVLALSTEVLVLDVVATIVQAGVSGLKSHILRCRVYFATFLALDK